MGYISDLELTPKEYDSTMDLLNLLYLVDVIKTPADFFSYTASIDQFVKRNCRVK